MADCVFCKIIKKELNSETVFETENLIAIKDIHPKAPVHLLVIPKKHILSVHTLTASDEKLLGEMIFTAKELAEKHGVGKSGYKLLFNVGEDGGQTVPHLHLHIMGGRQLGE